MFGRRTRRRPARIVAAALAVLAACAACGGERASAPHPSPGRDAVTVASFNFPESELLAEIYAQALEAAGIPVRRELDLGTRELVQPAMQEYLVDVVPEYLGTALASVDPGARVDWHDAAAVLAALRRALVPRDLVPLQPAAASDQNGFAVTTATARRLRLHTLSDLGRLRPPLVLAGPSECPVRPYCLVGLHRVYGITVTRFMAIDDQAQRESALEEGVADVAVTFTTSGAVASGRVVLLRDDRALQPTERVVPVVSQRALTRFGPRLQHVLEAVSAHLDTAGLRFLNWRISEAGRSVAAEARGWLYRHGLLRRR